MKLARKKSLPSLAFGHSIAKTTHSFAEMEAKIFQAKAWEAKYEPIGPESDFVNHSSIVNINGLSLTAIAHSPMLTNVVSPNSSMLVFTIGGESYDSVVNGKKLSYQMHEHAAFVPEGRRIGRGGYRSVLMIDVDKSRLQRTVDTMSGEQGSSKVSMNLELPQSLALRVGNVSLNSGLENLCKLVDLYCSTPQILSAMAVDENFYRLMAMMFNPQWLASSETKADSHTRVSGGMDIACQYALANLEFSITLTDLENVAKVSSRSLQYAFIKKFGCSPMQWLRDQRLQRAHYLLCNARAGDTVTMIAHQCGIPHLSQFSAYYQQKFAQLPSATLAHSLKY